MASASPFQVEDQTDEDFFDKLVDDEFSIERSQSASCHIARDLSSLSLGDVGTSLDDARDSGFASESNEWQQNENVRHPETPRKDNLVSESSLQSDSSVGRAAESPTSTGNTVEITPPASSKLNSSESKSSGVKQVQWSAFTMNFGQFEKYEEGRDSAFFADSANVSAGEMKVDATTTVNYVDNQGQTVTANDNSSGFTNTESLALVNSHNADWNESQYWEKAYPGWKYDSATGQWYQVDGYDISSGQSENFDADSGRNQHSFQEDAQSADVLSVSSDKLHLQQTTHPVLDTIEENSILTNVSNWKLSSEGSIEYPPNMVFDPQYPGWYYDTNTQQWCTLETYNEIIQKDSTVDKQVNQEQTTAGFSETSHSFYDGYEVSESKFVQDHSNLRFTGDWNASTNVYAPQDESASTRVSTESHSLYNGIAVSETISVQNQDNVVFSGDWNASTSTYAHSNIWQPGQVVESAQLDGFSRNHLMGNLFNSTVHAGSHTTQQFGTKNFESAGNINYSNNNGFLGSHVFNPKESKYQFNHSKVEQSLHSHLSNSYYNNQKSVNFSQHQLHSVNNSYSQSSYPSNKGRSSDGRPTHALVAFGFGGKLIVMKDSVSLGATFAHGNQGNPQGEISIHNLSELVKGKSDSSSIIEGSPFSYFDTLRQQSFPGPLVSGNAATKDVIKWLDERVAACDSPAMDFHRGKHMRLLLSLLKISCQHYGKLRSPYRSDLSLEGTDGPEMAIAKLFASAKKTNALYGDHDTLRHCMQNLPSEGKIRATAIEVQNLLVSGRRKEALQYAQEGQLWGPALVLAEQFGHEFYVDTIRKMASYQFIPGSPLRTLCLLLAGKPADAFYSYSSTASLSNGLNAPQQPSEIHGNGMLDEWEENLAIITANRTKDDELVMIHLGDCLWKERVEVIAAHICYLVADANFESYSGETTRLCLIGADHWKYPRTYASPDAIQRTEIYEYSKVLGNAQFILLPFQPYKLVYAYMLAEVGKISDSLRYCQACLKLLKNLARAAPEVEMCKSLFSSLEERLRTHQQGGYSSNLDPTKLVGKLFTSIDKSIHRMMGVPTAPLPPMPQGTINHNKELYVAPKVANSQSTMTMPSLISSASVETMSQLAGDSNRKSMHNRSISEPNFGRTPNQDAGSNGSQTKESGGSRFGRIGSQLLQKTMGWVSKSHRQAKLGEQNKFYYDEKLKRWVEEGAEMPAEAPVLAPPPKAAYFQNVPDCNVNSSLKNDIPPSFGGQDTKPSIPLETNSGIPPIPPSQNQFSSRARMGIPSRYVDTFNKGGAAFTSSFQSPAAPAPSVKPSAMIGANFFVPSTPAILAEQRTDTPGESDQICSNQEEISSVLAEPSYSSPSSSSSSSIQRFPSMDNMASMGNKASGAASWSGNGPLSHNRAASWSGSSIDAFSTSMYEFKSRSNGHEITSFLPNTTSNTDSDGSSSLPHNGGAPLADLHEVDL